MMTRTSSLESFLLPLHFYNDPPPCSDSLCSISLTLTLSISLTYFLDRSLRMSAHAYLPISTPLSSRSSPILPSCVADCRTALAPVLYRVRVNRTVGISRPSPRLPSATTARPKHHSIQPRGILDDGDDTKGEAAAVVRPHSSRVVPAARALDAGREIQGGGAAGRLLSCKTIRGALGFSSVVLLRSLSVSLSLSLSLSLFLPSTHSLHILPRLPRTLHLTPPSPFPLLLLLFLLLPPPLHSSCSKVADAARARRKHRHEDAHNHARVRALSVCFDGRAAFLAASSGSPVSLASFCTIPENAVGVVHGEGEGGGGRVRRSNAFVGRAHSAAALPGGRSQSVLLSGGASAGSGTTTGGKKGRRQGSGGGRKDKCNDAETEPADDSHMMLSDVFSFVVAVGAHALRRRKCVPLARAAFTAVNPYDDGSRPCPSAATAGGGRKGGGKGARKGSNAENTTRKKKVGMTAEAWAHAMEVPATRDGYAALDAMFGSGGTLRTEQDRMSGGLEASWVPDLATVLGALERRRQRAKFAKSQGEGAANRAAPGDLALDDDEGWEGMLGTYETLAPLLGGDHLRRGAIFTQEDDVHPEVVVQIMLRAHLLA